MKNICKINNILNLPGDRPIVALDTNRNLTYDIYEYVDMGLGVLWATRNLGASNGDTPESWYGDYYAWGEIEIKKNYSWKSYKYCKGSLDTMTKYCQTNMGNYWGGEGEPDNIISLLNVDNIVIKKFRGKLNFPTAYLFLKLVDSTNDEWVTNYNGIEGLNGKLLTSKINGNKLFFPAGGIINETTINSIGRKGYLWAINVYVYPFCAKCMYFDETIYNHNDVYRCYGANIRPIKNV